MARSAILLRAVNVGGHNRLPTADLRAALAAVGFTDVETLLQSGNAVGRGGPRNATRVAAAIEAELRTRPGIETVAFVRTAAALRALLHDNPFGSTGHVAFLRDAPSAEAIAALDAFAAGGTDLAVVRGTDVFLHYPNGTGRARLSNARLEAILGVPATTRNWNTVTKLADLASD